MSSVKTWQELCKNYMIKFLTKLTIKMLRTVSIPHCGGLIENGPHRLTGNGITGEVALLEMV